MPIIDSIQELWFYVSRILDNQAREDKTNEWNRCVNLHLPYRR